MVAINLARYSPRRLEEHRYERSNLLEKLNLIEENIVDVENSSLPKGVSGYYSPATESGAVGKDLPEPYKTFVREHEKIHISTEDEYQTDVLAAARTGHPEYIRGIFYKPPINLY